MSGLGVVVACRVTRPGGEACPKSGDVAAGEPIRAELLVTEPVEPLHGERGVGGP